MRRLATGWVVWIVGGLDARPTEDHPAWSSAGPTKRAGETMCLGKEKPVGGLWVFFVRKGFKRRHPGAAPPSMGVLLAC